MKKIIGYIFFICSSLLVVGSNGIAMDEGIFIPRELNPAKGITIWEESPKEEIISWPSYHDFSVLKKVRIMMDGELKITFSPYTLLAEYAALFSKMDTYDLGIVNHACYQTRKFKIDEYGVEGYMFGESAIIEKIKYLIKLEGVIQSLENDIFQRGGRRIYITLANAQSEIDPLHRTEIDPLYRINYLNFKIAIGLRIMGFVNISRSRNLKTSEWNSDYMKELLPKNSLGHPQVKLSPGSIRGVPKIEWGREESSLIFPPYPCLLNKFSFFVRDKQGEAIGCVVGFIEHNAIHPHAHINLLFMDESIRGIGLGKKTMEFAENYIKEQGIGLIGLFTADHQAPLFYEKRGYVKDSTRPKLFKRQDGQYINKYKYYKVLN